MGARLDFPDIPEIRAWSLFAFMIDFSRNHFELFGLPERFRFDPAVLDSAYHALQGDARVTRVPSATIGLGAHERGRWTAPGI